MILRPACLILLFAIGSTSCVSFKASSQSTEPSRTSEPAKLAYVLNRDAQRSAYRILRHSPRYEFVRDSSQAEVYLSLDSLVARPVPCLTPQATLTMLTLGFYPVKTDVGYDVRYEEISNGQRSTIEKSVVVTTTTSWFHLFSPRKSRNKAIGRAL